MPLKLVSPREGYSPNYRVRGTHFGVSVNRTTGTPDRKKARKALQAIQTDIERGALAPKNEPTFSVAALSYLQSGGEDTFLEPIINEMSEVPLSQIDQMTIDGVASKLYPDASPATRNRQVYTPISAILKHVGAHFTLKRPKGSGGEAKENWLWPEQAWTILSAAEEVVDLEFRIFLATLLYTGMRLSECLSLDCDDVNLSESFAYLAETKNQDPRPVHLPPQAVAELTNLPKGLDRSGERVFRFRKNGGLYKHLKKVKRETGIEWLDFHAFRHTYGTWMMRYGGLNTKGLVATGTWRSEKSASRYMHVVVTEEARRADLLPAANSCKTRAKSQKSS